MAKRIPRNQVKQTRIDTQKRDHSKKFSLKTGAGRFVLPALGAIVGLALLITLFAWLASQPAPVQAAVGDEVAVGAADHITVGTDPGPFPTNPPAGGKHYPEEGKQKFYEESDAASLPKFQEGYLVHNLEHGYIIFWYNCNATTQVDCSALKSDIRKVMGEFNGVKMIAFPWPSQKEPLVLTSWGRIMRLNQADLEKMRAFYRANLNKAPEPNAQ